MIDQFLDIETATQEQKIAIVDALDAVKDSDVGTSAALDVASQAQSEAASSDLVVSTPLQTKNTIATQSVLWLRDVTGLTGGGANLDGVVTAGVSVERLVSLDVGGAHYVYELIASSAAESSPTVIRPDDYAVSTNEKVWQLKVFVEQSIGGLSEKVSGPASATDERIVIFNGVTGKLVKVGTQTVAGVLNRSNHTGTQLASTISDFNTAALAAVPDANATTKGIVELATTAESELGSDTSRAVVPSGLPLRKNVANAWYGPDFTGNARGTTALDIQSYRALAAQVASGQGGVAVGTSNTASGGYFSSAVGSVNTASALGASAFGYKNTASGVFCSSFGYGNTASGYYGQSTAIGYSNTASGNYNTAIGRDNTASGYSFSVAVGSNNLSSGNFSLALGNTCQATNTNSIAFGRNSVSSAQSSTAFGYACNATGSASTAFGYFVNNSVNSVTEIGYWLNSSTRSGAIRAHSPGMVGITIQNRATEYDDGGATAGSEADNTLGREMFALRRDADDIYVDINIGGTVKTISLGTAV